MTSPRATHSASDGAELARGYIALTVRYGSAMSQIARDFGTVEQQAKQTGERAAVQLANPIAASGTKAAGGFRQGLIDGLTQGLPQEGERAAGGFREGFVRGMISALEEGGRRGGSALSGGIAPAIEELKARNIGLRQTIIDASNAYNDLKTSGKASASELAAAHQNYTAAVQASRQTTQDLRVATAAAAKEGKAGWAGVKSTLGETAESMGTLGLAGEEVVGKVGGIGSALLGLAKNPVVLVTAAVVALGAATVEVTHQVYDLGKEWAETFDALEIKTGASGQRLADMESSVKAVAGTVPQSISQIGNVMAVVNSAFHDSGSGAENVTRTVEHLQSMVGNIDLTKLGMGFRAFGIQGDAEKQIDTLNRLFAASQDTQIPINQLVSAMDKAAPSAREMGLSITDATTMMAQFDQAGINPTATIFTLSRAAKEFQKHGEDMHTSLKTALVDIKSLLDAGKETEALQKATEIFGPTSGRGGAGTIIQALQQGLDPAAIQAELAPIGDKIDETYEKTKRFAQVWGEMKGSIEAALEPLATTVFHVFEGALEGLANWVSTHKSQIIGFFVDLGDAAIVTVQNVVGGLGLAVEAIGKLATGLALTYSTVMHIGGAIKDFEGDTAEGDHFRKLGDDAVAATRDVTHFGQDMVNFATGPAARFKSKLDEIGVTMQESAKLTDGLGTSVKTLGKTGDDVSIDIKENTPEVRDKLDKLHVHLEAIAGDPTHMKLVPDTEEAAKMLTAFRGDEEGKPPIQVKVGADTDPIKARIEGLGDWFKQHPLNVFMHGSWDALDALPGMTLPPGPGSPTTPDPLAGIPGMQTAPGHADGAITYATGGLPHSAKIQSSVRPRGLVNWAEPSTGGEAYIPLASSKRGHSFEIWKQTGHLLGVTPSPVTHSNLWKSYDDGGLRTGVILPGPQPRPGPDDPHGTPQPGHSPKPGDNPREKAGWPDWEHGGFGDPPSGWWTKPPDPDEILFPDFVPPGQREQQKKIWERLHPRVKLLSFDTGGISGADPRQSTSSVLQVIWDNTATGQKVGEAGGQLVGPGTSQPGYYAADWAGHTGHVHTSFAASPLTGQPYGLPKGSNIGQGKAGFPGWVYALGNMFGLEGSTYPGHQENSGFNRGIDWWPKGHSDMSGQSYSNVERGRLQKFAEAMASAGSRTPTRSMMPHSTGSMGRSVNFSRGGPGGGGSLISTGGSTYFGGGGMPSMPSSFGGGGGGMPSMPSGFGGGGGGMPSMPSGFGSGGFPSDAGTRTTNDANDPVSAIVAEGRRRGYTDEQISWIVADSIGESGLNPNIGTDHHGLFQQDKGYAGRDTMQGQVTGFYDRLDATSPGMSIGDRISKPPSQGGVQGGGYGSDWIAANLDKARSAMANITTGGLDQSQFSLSDFQTGPTAKEQEAEDKKEAALQKRIDKLDGEIKKSQDELGKASFADDKTKIQAKIDGFQEEIDTARTDLATAKSDYQNTLKTKSASQLEQYQSFMKQKDGSGGTTAPKLDLNKLGDIISSGITESLLPPGFMNPFSTGLMQKGSVLLDFFGSLVGKDNPQAGAAMQLGGAMMSGKGSNIGNAILGFVQPGFGENQVGSPGFAPGAVGPGGPNDLPGMNLPIGAMPGTGPLPGPDKVDAHGHQVNIDNSTHLENSHLGYSHEDLAPTLRDHGAAKHRASSTVDTHRAWHHS